GGLIIATWLSLPNAIEAARKHGVEQAEQAAKQRAERQGIPGPFRHAESGLVLKKPTATWLLLDGEKARRFDPKSVAAAVNNAPLDEDLIVGTVMVEKLPDVDPAEIDIAQVTET